ncbi:MAG: pyridoxal phosphate-dependent aminotransferase family protein [Bacteroidales bacterium]|nr:pyridoxal phosphate-dependent aminotransferase family protein [Bacteroidales bacterium]
MADQRKHIMEGPAGPEVIIDGKKYLYFAGTGYFQLHSHTELIQASGDAVLQFGIGSATSRAMAGTTPLLLQLEEKIAEYFGTEDAAYLPSGYLSNIAGLKALNDLDLYDVIFIDEGSHYSNIEGAETAGKLVVKFANRNVEDLKLRLDETLKQNQRPLIATDGLFPIRAKLAPLVDYLDLAEKNNGLVWIDDAHGVGILGQNGRGTCEHLGLNSERLFMGATLSKAFGAYGGIIPGRTDFVRQVRAGSVITGSNSPMTAAIAAGLKGLELVKNNPGMREKLWENARYLKTGMESIHIPTDDNCLPIVAFTPGDAASMTAIHEALMEDGIFIQYSNYRGAGKEGVLRIVVFSTHTKDQIDTLVEGLRKNIPPAIR